MIDSLFIANRGEIAVRIIRTARELGIRTVVGYSTEDANSLGVKLADDTVCLGPAEAIASYMNVRNIIAGALLKGCQAVHPGVGFLAENDDFAERVIENGLIFIGPRPETLRALGNKIRARQLATELSIPIIPGSEGSIDTLDEAIEVGREIGYPILLKASAGGGGKGIRIVRREEELKEAMQFVSKEAMAAFGDGTLFVERFLENPRHVEVQLVADEKGNVLVFGERDCTIQINHQKIVEEQPATCIEREVKKRIEADAVKLLKELHFVGAGTVEFLYSDNEYYFMEVNPRIQVEHPVTEMVVDKDLIALQIMAAGGKNLSEIFPSDGEELMEKRYALECRVNALKPGQITEFIAPGGFGVRVDTHIYPGYFVSPYYDALLLKLITFAESRGKVIERMKRALEETFIGGIETNMELLKKIITNSEFRSNSYGDKLLKILKEG